MISVSKQDFCKAVAITSSVVGKRNTIPVLTTLKATANGALALEGTDLDAFMRVEIPYSGESGDFIIPEPRGILGAVKASTSETISINPDEAEKTLRVATGSFAAELRNSIPADDHPGAERVVDAEFTATLGDEFFRQINRVRPAISTEETRYYLNGVFFHKIDGAEWLYRLVATDGHRLHIADIALPDADGKIPSVIIPRPFVVRAEKVFAKAKDGVRLCYGYAARSNRDDKTLDPPRQGSPRLALIGEVGVRAELTGKLIDGTFPDYTRVIPTEHNLLLRTKRAALLDAIRTISPLSTGKTRAIRLLPGKRMLRVELHSPDIGKSAYEIEAEHNCPNGFVIGFNGRYLLDALTALGGDEVDFGLNDPASPASLTDPADTAFKVVLMPMRV